MTGILEKVLIDRYGAPIVVNMDDSAEYHWYPREEDKRTILFMYVNYKSELYATSSSIKDIYGNAKGGFLLGRSLKIALIQGGNIYGLCKIHELQKRPEIMHALKINPNIEYFMDASNVWYYGHYSGNLYVYDSETGELDQLGAIELALNNLLEEWDSIL